MKRTRRSAPRLRVRKAPLRGPKRPKPTGQQKKRKLKVPKRVPRNPLKPQGPPPSHFELLQDAVQTLRDKSKGATLAQIRQHLQRMYRGGFDKESNDLLTTALERLAERGMVIRKEGCKYRFNEPNVDTSADTSAASSFTGTSRSGASQSGASPTESGATAAKSADSHTSASSSFSDSNRCKESPQDEAPEDKSPENVDGEGKSSTGDSSSSAPSTSSTASRASSRRR